MKKIYALLIITTIIFSACQSTPEQEVVNRRSFKMLLEENTQTERQEYPAEFSDEFMSKDGKVKIIFDAKVITPDVDKFPVIQIKPQPVTKEIMQLAVDEFMGGETGYYPESYMTKDEIEERLLNFYAKLDNEELIRQEFEKNMPEADIDYDAVRQAIKRRIAEYTAMRENAPEEKENVLSYYNMRPDMFYCTDDHNYRTSELAMTQDQLDERINSHQENLYLVSDRQMGDEHLRLIVYNELPTLPGQPHNFGLHSAEYYGVHVIRARNDFLQLIERPLCSAHPTNTSREGVENFDTPYPYLTISEDEAERLARQMLEDLGIDNFYLANSKVVPSKPTAEEYAAFFNAVQEDESISGSDYFKDMGDKFYLLTFKPEYYGIPLVHANNQYSQEQITYLPFAFEEIKIKVSNDTVAEFKWSNPADVSNVLNENAKLLPFDEIAKIAANHMKLKYNMVTIASLPADFPSYEQELAKYLSAEIKITEIRLGLGGVPAYNSAGEYMLIPVWSFYGAYDIQKDDDSHSYEDMFMPLVSVNAVDGSVIEQRAWADYD